MASRISAILCFLAHVFFAASISGVPQPLQNECNNKTIFDFIVSENLSPTISFDNNGSNFNILANLLAAGNNEGVLNVSTPGGITFFAPNDEAMVRTAQDLGYEGGDEYGAYQYIVSYLSRRYENPIEYIFNMPLYHIVAPGMNLTEVFMKTSFATWDSGLPLQRTGLQFIDRNPELPDVELVPEMSDICMLNGFIHVINRVLFSGVLNQTDESSKSQGREQPCLEHSEQPMYTPEEGELGKADSLPEPTTEAVVYGEVEETPFDQQSSISASSRYVGVGPVDLSGITTRHTSSSSHPLLSFFEVLEEEELIETQSAKLLSSLEPTLKFSPAWTDEEPVDSTPVPQETPDYSPEPSAPLDGTLYPAVSPATSFDFPTPVSLSEYAPSPEVQESTVEPSVLPSPPVTYPSSSETPDAFESEPTTLDSFTDGPSPNYVNAITPPVPSFASNVGPVLHSPESIIAEVLELLEGSASPGAGIDPSLEVSLTDLPEITGFPDIDGCFPRTSTVHLSNGKDIQIHELQAGHAVMCGESKSSTVYMFSHKQPRGMHPFVRIKSKDNHTIELSPEHYIYANGRLVIAEHVRVGDMLRTLDGPSKVSMISKVTRTGLYAPHTMHGDIVVGRIVASTYTNALPYWVVHPVLEVIRLPVRLGIAKEPIGSLLYNGCTKWRDIRTWLFGVPQTM